MQRLISVNYSANPTGALRSILAQLMPNVHGSLTRSQALVFDSVLNQDQKVRLANELTRIVDAGGRTGRGIDELQKELRPYVGALLSVLSHKPSPSDVELAVRIVFETRRLSLWNTQDILIPHLDSLAMPETGDHVSENPMLNGLSMDNSYDGSTVSIETKVRAAAIVAEISMVGVSRSDAHPLADFFKRNQQWLTPPIIERCLDVFLSIDMPGNSEFVRVLTDVVANPQTPKSRLHATLILSRLSMIPERDSEDLITKAYQTLVDYPRVLRGREIPMDAMYEIAALLKLFKTSDSGVVRRTIDGLRQDSAAETGDTKPYGGDRESLLDLIDQVDNEIDVHDAFYQLAVNRDSLREGIDCILPDRGSLSGIIRAAHNSLDNRQESPEGGAELNWFDSLGEGKSSLNGTRTFEVALLDYRVGRHGLGYPNISIPEVLTSSLSRYIVTVLPTLRVGVSEDTHGVSIAGRVEMRRALGGKNKELDQLISYTWQALIALRGIEAQANRSEQTPIQSLKAVVGRVLKQGILDLPLNSGSAPLTDPESALVLTALMAPIGSMDRVCQVLLENRLPWDKLDDHVTNAIISRHFPGGLDRMMGWVAVDAVLVAAPLNDRHGGGPMVDVIPLGSINELPVEAVAAYPFSAPPLPEFDHGYFQSIQLPEASAPPIDFLDS